MLPKTVFGQSVTPAGNSTVCPGERITYTISPSPYSGCTFYTWTVTNGAFSSTDNTITSKSTTSTSVDVWWNDTPKTGTLKVTSNCSSGGEFSVTEKYAILSLKDRVPANPRANQLLPFCSTGTIQLAVDVMFLENTGGTTGVPQKRADGYEWVLPTGWSSNGSTGTVSTTTEYINIVPDNGCRGGSVTVKAYISSCNSGRKYSSSASISIDRPGFSSNLGVPSGYSGPRCGNKNPVTFTAANLSCASSYRWTATGTGWKDANGNLGPWTTATNTLTLTPTGTSSDDGVISVDINIGCDTKTQTYRAIYTDPKQPTPSISRTRTNQAICIGDAEVFTCTPPSGYPTNYGFDWAATGGLLINGVAATTSSPYKTTSNSVTISMPSGAKSGFKYVYVSLNDNTCTPSDYNGLITWAGIISSSQFSISGPSTLCPNTTESYLSTFIDPSITNYQWGWSGVTSQGGQGTPYLNVYAPSNFQNGSVTLRLGNRCGLTGSPAYVYLTLSSSCGYYYMASPNPARGTLRVEATPADPDAADRNKKNKLIPDEISVALLNKKSEVLLSGKIEDGKLEMDVSQLPNDTYFLRFIHQDRMSLLRILVDH